MDTTHPGRRTVAGRTIRWDDEFAARAYESGMWVESTLADELRRAAQDTPDRIVLVDGAIRLTCRDLHGRAEALAAVLAARMPVGSVVSFMLPNWPRGGRRVSRRHAGGHGGQPHPAVPARPQARFILADAHCRMIFIPSTFRGHDYAAMLHRVTGALDEPPEVVVLRGDASGHSSFDDLGEASADPVAIDLDPDAVRMIMYTSGTTGRPKGVLHTHNSIHALITQIGMHWSVDPGDRFLVPSPIAHIGGSIYAFECPLLLGSTAVLMERWDADDAVATMLAERCTHMAGATPFLDGLLGAAERAGSALPDLKVFICGGASVPPSLIRRATAYFARADVSRVYGSTEVPVTTVGALGEPDVAADTDGRPGIADVWLVARDPGGMGGQTGEIRVRGAQMLVGYLHADDEADAFDADGYFRTGDIGQWADGALVVTGRVKDLIIRNGENVSPKEIEDLLVGRLGIAEVAVVGVPDARTGERACAVLVLAAGSEQSPTVTDLGDFLAEQGVARFKVPEQVVVWDALPRNDAGKVLKHRMRDALVGSGGDTACR